MRQPLAGRHSVLLAILAGALAALGLAPFDLWPLGLAGFALGIWSFAKAARPGLIAFVFGLGYFAVALHWIVEPFFVDLARHGWMAPFALILMASGMALFWWLAGALAVRMRVPRVLGFALNLAVAEMVRAYLLSGFPWAHPGHILIDTPLLQLSAFVGPHGLTVLVLGFAAALASLRPVFGGVGLGAVIAMIFVLPEPAPMGIADDAPVIRLVQPNAPQDQKWDPEMIPVFFDRGLSLSRGDAVDLIVWPETALPVLLEDSERWRAAIAEAVDGTPVIVGANRWSEGQAQNALVVLDGQGEVSALYDKHRLVPFGEYIPLRALADRLALSGLAEQISGGYWPGDGPWALDLGPLGRVFPMICYEAIFPQYLRQVDRPDWQLHLTNDAWFGDFAGPYQHLALARLRAAESGLPLLRSANTGISAVIDARGQVLDSLPLNEAGALDVRLPPALPPTLYTRMGDGPLAIIHLLTFAAVLGWSRKRGVEHGRGTD